MKILSTILSALTALLLAGVPANARAVFSGKKAGLWAEGGHDTGYVSAGLSFKF